MADIFISYKKEDAGRVVRIVEGLRAEGFSVWWDHGIAPGSQWDQTIQRELNAAKIVVAVWSEQSVHAPWVKEEAGVGKSRGALVPVRIDDVEPPLGFGLIQFADLINWDGDIEDSHWDFFIESVRAVMSGEPMAGLEKPRPKRRLPFVPIVTGLVALIAAGAAGLWAMNGGLAPPGPAPATGTATAATAPAPSGPSAPTEGEEAMYQAASETRLKADWQDFLRSFPNGYYASQVREQILPLCAGEMRPVWREPPVTPGQMFRAASPSEDMAGNDVSYSTRGAACEAAQADWERSADSYCRAFATSMETRNVELGTTLADCECQEIQGNWFCYTDSTYSCRYEMKTEQYVEVCG